jgi:hypothetical protein
MGIAKFAFWTILLLRSHQHGIKWNLGLACPQRLSEDNKQQNEKSTFQ